MVNYPEKDEMDLKWMQKALEEAEKAFEEDEVPIGAVVIYNNKIIGKGYNQTDKLSDITAHAEMLAITAAANHLGGKYLEECTLYVTVEPCVMCAGAIKNARFGRIVYGTSEPKTGYTLFLNPEFNKKTVSRNGILADKCRDLMQNFFKVRRKN